VFEQWSGFSAPLVDNLDFDGDGRVGDLATFGRGDDPDSRWHSPQELSGWLWALPGENLGKQSTVVAGVEETIDWSDPGCSR
jgi:hypothetical protein